MRIIGSLLGLALLAACGRTPPPVPATLPLPVLPKGEIELRVAYVVNPRLPRMNDAQLALLLDQLRQTSQVHFGVSLRFTPIQTLDIAQAFARIPPDRQQAAQALRADLQQGTVDLPRLAAAYADTFRLRNETLPELLRYVDGHLPEPKPRSLESLGSAVAKLHVQRAQSWMNIRASDGKPVLDAHPYNEFVFWVALGYGGLPYELLLTNQPILSVEYAETAIASALRGGYTNGVTTYGSASRYGAFSVWSTFAFSAQDDWTVQMRGGERYTPEQAAALSGIAATHEIGHQLFHYSHPFGQSACVMNPVPLFAYQAWAAALSPQDCPANGSPAMRPGAATLYY